MRNPIAAMVILSALLGLVVGAGLPDFSGPIFDRKEKEEE